MKTLVLPLLNVVFLSTAVTANVPIPDQPGKSQAHQAESGSQKKSDSLEGAVYTAETQLENLRKYFKTEKSIVKVFDTLNGHDSTNSAGQRLNDEDAKISIQGVKCICDGKWAVTGTGKDNGAVVTWVDALGKSVLDQMLDALRQSGDKGVARLTVTTSIKSPIGGDPIKSSDTYVLASSKYLMKGKNSSGEKFFCFVKVSN